MTLTDPRYMTSLTSREIPHEIANPSTGNSRYTQMPRIKNRDKTISQQMHPELDSQSDPYHDPGVILNNNNVRNVGHLRAVKDHADTAGNLHQNLFHGRELYKLSTGQSLDSGLELLSGVIESTVNFIPSPDLNWSSGSTPRRIADEKQMLNVSKIAAQQSPVQTTDEINLDSEMDPHMINIIDKHGNGSNVYESGLFKQKKPKQSSPIDVEFALDVQVNKILHNVDGDNRNIGIECVPDIEDNFNRVDSDLEDAPREYKSESSSPRRHQERTDQSILDSQKMLTSTYTLSPKFPIVSNILVPEEFSDPLQRDATAVHAMTNMYTPSSFIYAFSNLLNPIAFRKDSQSTTDSTNPKQRILPTDEHNPTRSTLVPLVNIQTYKHMIELFASSTSALDDVAFQFFKSIPAPPSYDQYVKQLMSINHMEKELEFQTAYMLELALPPQFRPKKSEIQNLEKDNQVWNYHSQEEITFDDANEAQLRGDLLTAVALDPEKLHSAATFRFNVEMLNNNQIDPKSPQRPQPTTDRLPTISTNTRAIPALQLDHKSQKIFEKWQKDGRRSKILARSRAAIKALQDQIALESNNLIDSEINSAYHAVFNLFSTYFEFDRCYLNGHYILDSQQKRLQNIAPEFASLNQSRVDSGLPPARLSNGPIFPSPRERRYFTLPNINHGSQQHMTEDILASFITLFSNPNSHISKLLQQDSHRELPALLHEMISLTKKRKVQGLKEQQFDATRGLGDSSLWNNNSTNNDDEDNDDSAFDTEDGDDGNQFENVIQDVDKHPIEAILDQNDQRIAKEQQIAAQAINNNNNNNNRQPKLRKLFTASIDEQQQTLLHPLTTIGTNMTQTNAENSVIQRNTTELSRSILQKQLKYQTSKVHHDQRIRTMTKLEQSYKTISQYQSRFLKRNWHLSTFEQVFALNYPTEWLHQRRRGAQIAQTFTHVNNTQQYSPNPIYSNHHSNLAASVLDDRLSQISPGSGGRRNNVQIRNSQYLKNLWK
jgi:hypothetical protein